MRTLHRAILCASALVTLAAIPAAQQPSRDAPARPSTGTAAIAGTILTDEPTAKPIRRVTLTLTAATAGLAVQRMTTSDDAGRFAFTRLPAGNYSAPRASRPGYVPATYGEKRTGGIGTPITLGEGQRLTIAMKMLRGAVITGMLIDQGSKPAIQTPVQATQMRIVNGERTPAAYLGSNSATTDDRGVYRIFGLPPGDYVVAASPRLTSSGEVRPITAAEVQWAQQQLQPGAGTGGASAAGATPAPKPGQAVAYTSVYYPGTTDVASAGIVTVAAGQERSGVDFGIQYVSTARVEGTVLDQDGQAPLNAQLNLVPKTDATAMVGDLFMLETMMLMRPTVVNGKFTLTGVKPGQYTLTARAAPRPAGGGPASAAGPSGPAGRTPPAPMTLWATTDISVDGADLTGIALRLEPGMTLTGRVAFDATTLQPPADLSRVSVRLSAAPTPNGITVSVGSSAGAVSADGTFKLEGVTPGRYLLSASAPAASAMPGTGWMVRSAIVSGVDAADVPFEVRPDQDISNAVVTFTDKVAELSGTLLDAAGHPTPEFAIILFPCDRAMWSQRSRRLRSPVRASTDGTFKFANLLPGEYFLAALSDFEPGDYNKPEFLEQVAAAAMKVTIAEGEKKVQDLKIAGGQTPAAPSVVPAQRSAGRARRVSGATNRITCEGRCAGSSHRSPRASTISTTSRSHVS